VGGYCVGEFPPPFLQASNILKLKIIDDKTPRKISKTVAEDFKINPKNPF